jgi:hypothetical protein
VSLQDRLADLITAIGGDIKALQGGFTPADHGLISWSYDPQLNTTTSIPTAGTLLMIRQKVKRSVTINNLCISIFTGGATLTSGQCFAALFDSGLVRRGITASQHTAWQSSGSKIMALTTPYAATPGDYFVGLYWNGTTGPSIGRAASQSSANFNLSGSTSRVATADTGLTTTMPSTAAALTKLDVAYWAGLS